MKTDNFYVADRRLYTDVQGRVVEADDPKRRTLLVSPGQRMLMREAIRLGLTGRPAAAAAPAEEKEAPKAENKKAPKAESK